MQLTGNWSYPTAIRFGAGRISEIADACNNAGMRKPLLVTDRGLANLPITQNTLKLLDQAGLGKAMFAEVDPNPNEKNLALGLEAYNEGGHDGVVAFGGGSGLDLGKVIAMMCGQTRPVIAGIGLTLTSNSQASRGLPSSSKASQACGSSPAGQAVWQGALLCLCSGRWMRQVPVL